MSFGPHFPQIELSELADEKHAPSAIKININDEGFLCSICLDACSGLWVVTPCKHYFHQDCLLAARQQKNLCPLCRRAILTPLEAFESISPVGSLLQFFNVPETFPKPPSAHPLLNSFFNCLLRPAAILSVDEKRTLHYWQTIDRSLDPQELTNFFNNEKIPAADQSFIAEAHNKYCKDLIEYINILHRNFFDDARNRGYFYFHAQQCLNLSPEVFAKIRQMFMQRFPGLPIPDGAEIRRVALNIQQLITEGVSPPRLNLNQLALPSQRFPIAQRPRRDSVGTTLSCRGLLMIICAFVFFALCVSSGGFYYFYRDSGPAPIGPGNATRADNPLAYIHDELALPVGLFFGAIAVCICLICHRPFFR